MASEIRVNQIQNRSGLSTVTFSDTGVVISGITTISDLRTSGTSVVAAGTTAAPSISPTGDSNTGIFFPSPDTVAIAEGGVEALRIDSSSNIGIGTTGTSDKLTVLGRVQIQQDSGSNNRLILRGQPGSTYRWNIDNNGSSNDLRIFREDDVTTAGGVVYASLSSSGNLTLNNGNLVIGTAGKGIDFSATANSSGTMTSELLSDYEVGTWTPTFYLNGVLQNYDADRQSCFYTKIGNLVYVQFWTGWGVYGKTAFPSSSSAVFEIGGLPYVSADAFYGGSMGNARTQGGTSDNLGLSILYQTDKISFTSTSGNYSSWSGNGRRSASSISGGTDVVIAGAITYVSS